MDYLHYDAGVNSPITLIFHDSMKIRLFDPGISTPKVLLVCIPYEYQAS